MTKKKQKLNPSVEQKRDVISKVVKKSFPDGVYTGTIKNGKRSGFGIIKAESGSYTGNWENDRYNGEGKSTLSDGTSYDGIWKHGMFHGYGE